MPLVPAWLVSVAFLFAALCVWHLRYMPRAVRLALVIPMLYLGGMYLYIDVSGMGPAMRTSVVRVGLLGLAVSQIASAAPYLYSLYKTKLPRGNHATRTE